MDLDYTGERIVPGRVDAGLLMEHLARYRFAAAFVPGRRVLDLGCGAGYGLAVLRAAGASRLTGVDCAPGAVGYASASYGGPETALLVADGSRLPFPDRSFDCVVSFEVIEHVHAYEALVGEARRVLRPDGLFILSTPDRRTYRRHESPNVFHVREFDATEFRALLERSFDEVLLYGQVTVEGMLIAPIDGRPSRLDADVRRNGNPDLSAPDYLIAICGRSGLQARSAHSLFLTSEANAFSRLRQQLNATTADLDEKRAWALELRAELDQRGPDGGSATVEVSPTPGGSKPGRDEVADALRVLVFVTVPVADARTALAHVPKLFGRPAQPTWIRSGRDPASHTMLEMHGDAVVVCPPGFWGLLGMVPYLRALPHDLAIVSFAKPGVHRRLKLISLLVGRRRLLVCNEAGGCFFAGGQGLWRHARWRLAEWLQVLRHQVSSAGHLVRAQGAAGLMRRVRERATRRTRLARTRWQLWRSGLGWSRLRLPETGSPVVSVIIPVHGHWRVTRRCLRSIAAHTSGVPFEVILVDDASPDDTRTRARSIPGLKIVELESNQGFIAACNRGARRAAGEYVVFLNNDTVVTDNWLPALIRVFEENADCGAVGAKLLYPNGRLQEAGGIVWRSGDAWNYGRGDDASRPEYNYLRRTDYCSGAALMVRRSVFESVGGFDELFRPAYWEDVDLCFRLAERGLPTWYQPASVVYHFDGKTAGTRESGGTKRFQVTNRQKFHDRWVARLARQPDFDPRHMFLGRDRHPGPLAVVFDHYVPMPDRDAGSLFMDRLLNRLVVNGYRVVFWPENLFALPGHTERLQQRGIEVAYGPVALDRFLRDLGKPIDVALVYRTHIAAKFLPVIRPYTRAAGYLLCDLESLRESRRAEVTGEASQVDAFCRQEQAALGLADVIGVHSPVELEILRALVPVEQRVLLLPLPGPPVRPGTAPFATRSGLLFIGSTHPPNVDGLLHFVSNVWPGVRAALNSVTLHVVGDVCQAVPQLAREPSIDLVGHVPDLEPWLDRSRVFVAPLRFGAGIKGKALAAMAAGVPLVTTPVGAEGIGLVGGRSAWIAETDEDFGAGVVALHETPAVWERMRHEALALVAERHCGDRTDAAVSEFVEAVRSIRQMSR